MELGDNKGKIAREIKDKIGKRKLKDFAKMVGIDKVQLSRYKRGVSIPRADIYRKIMEFDYEENIPMVREKGEYEVQRYNFEKLLNSLKEILESGNEKAIELLVANIDAFLEMVRISKNKDGNKGGY